MVPTNKIIKLQFFAMILWHALFIKRLITLLIIHPSSTGNNLPYPIEAAASVPYKDSFLLVGGYLYDTDEVLDTIIKYNPEDDSWLEMPAKLQTPRYWHTVIPVKQSIFNSC